MLVTLVSLGKPYLCTTYADLMLTFSRRGPAASNIGVYCDALEHIAYVNSMYAQHMQN
jgi:hypothetical protein